jgi:hypothetical protein
MKKRIVIGAIVVLVLVIIIGFVLKDSFGLSECEKLSSNFDSVDLRGSQGIIGGTLTNIIGPKYEESYNLNSYFFSFHGKIKDYDIYVLQGSNSIPLSYEIGKFYKFDLSKKRISGYLSGSFIDINSTLFIPMEC